MITLSEIDTDDLDSMRVLTQRRDSAYPTSSPPAALSIHTHSLVSCSVDNVLRTRYVQSHIAVGGEYFIKLFWRPKDISHLMVYLNGDLLTPFVHYYLIARETVRFIDPLYHDDNIITVSYVAGTASLSSDPCVVNGTLTGTSQESFVASSGQQTFDLATEPYAAKFLDVKLNGSHLSHHKDFTVRGGDLKLNVPAMLDSLVDVRVFDFTTIDDDFDCDVFLSSITRETTTITVDDTTRIAVTAAGGAVLLDEQLIDVTLDGDHMTYDHSWTPLLDGGVNYVVFEDGLLSGSVVETFYYGFTEL